MGRCPAVILALLFLFSVHVTFVRAQQGRGEDLDDEEGFGVRSGGRDDREDSYNVYDERDDEDEEQREGLTQQRDQDDRDYYEDVDPLDHEDPREPRPVPRRPQETRDAHAPPPPLRPPPNRFGRGVEPPKNDVPARQDRAKQAPDTPSFPVRRPLPCNFKDFRRSQTQKVAVLFVHGLGAVDRDSWRPLGDALHKHVADVLQLCRVPNIAEQIVIEPVYWADLAKKLVQTQYEGALSAEPNLGNVDLRRFILDLVGGAVTYLPVGEDDINRNEVFRRVSQALNRLGSKAGPAAPLVIVAHSFGAVLVHDYLVALQNNELPPPVSGTVGKTALAQGDTLTLLYTTGNPQMLFALREKDFGKAPQIPPSNLKQYWPMRVADEARWVNFYDRQDVLAYPLKPINSAYGAAVTEDWPLNLGAESETPATTHDLYWNDSNVLDEVAFSVGRVWMAVNHRFTDYGEHVLEAGPFESRIRGAFSERRQ